MIEFLEDLRWLDWVGSALAAYGIVAGAFRGTVHQFIRLLVLMVALALVGLLGTPLLQAMSSFLDEGADAALLTSRLELALVVVLLPSLTLLRRFLAGESKGPTGWAARTGGALAGLLASLVLATVVGCAAFWIDGGHVPVAAKASKIGRTVAEGASRIPCPPRPSFLVPRAFPR
ncbi:MAG: CvpA family protein [Planctomycetes bacterium]|nr:CvpA family protein [Planctomycetota bacterium]